MTQKNKLIVGGVVVLVAYYLYDRNKKMKATQDLKAGAEVTPEPEVSSVPVGTGGIKPMRTIDTLNSQSELATTMR